MAELPSGTVTFLFTDIEGSTTRWEQWPEAMRVALARHDALIRAAIVEHGGHVVKTMGDAFHAAFARAPDAVGAATDAQRRLQAEPWGGIGPVRVRMALHTGAAEERDGDYNGPTLNRAARLMSAGHGGQVLLSQATSELIRDGPPEGTSLRDLGEHRLKDLSRPEHVFQFVSPDLLSEFPPLRSLDVLPNNLPRQLTSFVGREREIAEVRRLLAATSLLTLVGTGGAGKTRLALQVAADILDEYADGAWLVELAPLADSTLVARTVASVLGVREQAGRSALLTLEEYLRPRSLLLVLDNCEHLVAACATLAEALLRACPSLRILATSREALGIAGETTWRVPSLGMPDPQHVSFGALDLASALSQYEAVRLFIDRAVAVAPTFSVTNRNAPAVAQICYRLDGIPLAIELAAARVRVLTPEQIAARLDDRLRLLTGGSRTALPRQQTLRALIDWSYDLLSDGERKLLGRLSVFAGGWTLDAAEAVCAGDGVEDVEVLDLLTQLVDKSMVIVEAQGDESHYRLLETLRQYGAEKLAATDDVQRLGRLHRDWFLQLAEGAEPELYGPQAGAWLDRLAADHDNLRAALAWSLADQGGESVEIALRLATALHELWLQRAHLSEGRRWLERALGIGDVGDRPPDAGASVPLTAGMAPRFCGAHPRVRALNMLANLEVHQQGLDLSQRHADEARLLAARVDDTIGAAHALIQLGNVARVQGAYERSAALLEEGLAASRAAGDLNATLRAVTNLGETSVFLGNVSRATELLEESLSIARALGDPWGVAQACRQLGIAAYRQGDFDRAVALLEEAIQQWRAIHATRGPQWALCELGHIQVARGDNSRAAACFEESMLLSQHASDRRGVARCLEGMAAVDLATDETVSAARLTRAARLLGSAAAQREALGTPLFPVERPVVEGAIAAARARLGDESYTAIVAEGRAMTLEQAVAYALDEPPSS